MRHVLLMCVQGHAIECPLGMMPSLGRCRLHEEKKVEKWASPCFALFSQEKRSTTHKIRRWAHPHTMPTTCDSTLYSFVVDPNGGKHTNLHNTYTYKEDIILKHETPRGLDD